MNYIFLPEDIRRESSAFDEKNKTKQELQLQLDSRKHIFMVVLSLEFYPIVSHIYLHWPPLESHQMLGEFDS